MYGHVITKFSRMGSLPDFLTHGAPRRASHASGSAIKSNSLYNLRSTGKLLLDHPKGKMLTTLGARSFSAAAPKLWNGLPVELRQATSLNSFKSRLKTYLFKKCFYSL